MTSAGDSAQVDVYVHTSHVEHGNQLARDSVTEALATIKRLVEEHHAAD